MVKVIQGRPAEMGFRMPAEWEPHEQCWMGWPVRTSPIPPRFSSPIRLSYPCSSSCGLRAFIFWAPCYGVGRLGLGVAGIRVLCCDAGIWF